MRGKRVDFRIKLTWGSTTTAGSSVWTFTLPFTADATGVTATQRRPVRQQRRRERPLSGAGVQQLDDRDRRADERVAWRRLRRHGAVHLGDERRD
jgi:hypothetical protein